MLRQNSDLSLSARECCLGFMRVSGGELPDNGHLFSIAMCLLDNS